MTATSYRLSACLLALLFLFTYAPMVWAQAPAWQTARIVAAATSAATTNSSEVKATATDAAGNVYLVGSFTNTVSFGSTTLTSIGARDVFVAKFNPVSQQMVWAQRAGGTSDDDAMAVAVSGTSVYVVGAYGYATADFGSIRLANAGSDDMFVAKLTDAGSSSTFVWAKNAGGADIDKASALAVNGTSVYVAGFFNAPTISFGTTTLTTAGQSDGFVAKLTDAGSSASFTWAQRIGGTTFDGVEGLAVQGTSVYAVGEFYSRTASFGPLTLTNAGNTNVFVAKLTDAGPTSSFTWAQRAGGAYDDRATAVAVNGANIYVGGRFQSTMASFGTTVLTNANALAYNYDVFVTKLTDAGATSSFVWAQRAGGMGYDGVTSLAVNNTSIYITGPTDSSPATFGSTPLPSFGSGDIFVAKLTDAGPTGAFDWAQRAGGIGNDGANALSLTGHSIYVSGFFRYPSASFGTTTLSNPTTNVLLGFLASLSDLTLGTTTATTPRVAPQVYPNPVRGAATATLTLPIPLLAPTVAVLTDALGRPVRSRLLPAGTSSAPLDVANLPAGLYLVRCGTASQQLIVE